MASTMSHLIATSRGLIKEAGRFADARRAFHAMGMAGRHKGDFDHAKRLASRWTPQSMVQGKVRPDVNIKDLRQSASPSFSESRRLKHTDNAINYSRKYRDATREANKHADQLFGADPGRLGRMGRTVMRGTARTLYDTPRALMFSPKSTTGMLGYMGIGAGASLMGARHPYEYAGLPFVAGRAAYLPQAKNDAKTYAEFGARQGADDMIQGYRGAKFTDRWRMAMDPGKTGIQGNQFSQNPTQTTGWQRAKSLGLGFGTVDENQLRNDIGYYGNQAAQNFLKQSGVMKQVGNLFGKVTKPISNTYKRLPVAAKVPLGLAGLTGGITIPGSLAYGAYSGERDKVQGVSYDQGYDTGQYQAQKYYQNLPTWQRAIAAVAPDFALNYAMSKGQKTPGYNDMNGDAPVTTMYNRPDGTAVY